MIRMISKVTIIGLAALGLWLVVPQAASALTLTPLSREINLTAGEKTLTTVELKNETTKSIELTTEVANFTAKGETGEPKFDFQAPDAGIATWIEVEAGPITLAAGEKKDIDVVFNTPATATSGGHYVAVFFNEVMGADAGGQVNIESKLGTLFLATVKGTYTEQGAIATFDTTNGKHMFSEGPIPFTLRFQNTGDIHLKPSGTITITNMFGKVVKKITVNDEGGATLPGTVREYTAGSWKDTGSAFGSYTAKVKLTAGGQMTTATFMLGVFPLTGIIIVIVILIVLVLIFLAVFNKKSTTVTRQ